LFDLNKGIATGISSELTAIGAINMLVTAEDVSIIAVTNVASLAHKKDLPISVLHVEEKVSSVVVTDQILKVAPAHVKSWKALFSSEVEDQLVSDTPTCDLDMTMDVQTVGEKVLGSIVRDQLVSRAPTHDEEMTMDVPNVGKKGSGAKVTYQVVSNAPAYDMDKTTVVPIVGKECSDEEVEAPLVSDAPAHEMDMTTVVPAVQKNGSVAIVEDQVASNERTHEMDMTIMAALTLQKFGSKGYTNCKEERF
jgi:hypothetical protein